MIIYILKKTRYEFYKGRKPNISYLDIFGWKWFVLNSGKDNLDKFDAKYGIGVFLATLFLVKHIEFLIKEHLWQ